MLGLFFSWEGGSLNGFHVMSSFVEGVIAMYFKALFKRILQSKKGYKPTLIGSKS
jgi:hypothetical protein